MVFNWLEGKTLKAEEIIAKHCEIVGEILAKIHNIDFSKIEDNKRKNIEKLIYADIYNGFGWANYNFKRSLCIENEYKQDEIELAENEIV